MAPAASASTTSPSPSSASADNTMAPQSAAPKSKRDIDLERKRARDRKSQQAMRDRAKWQLSTLNEQVNVLNEQVGVLQRALEEQSGHLGVANQRCQGLESRAQGLEGRVQELGNRVLGLEGENEHLRVQNAALRLSLMGDGSSNDDGGGNGRGGKAEQGGGQVGGRAGSVIEEVVEVPIWQIPPNNTPPQNVSDSIYQGLISARRRTRTGSISSVGAMSASSPISPGTMDTSGGATHASPSSYPLKPNLCVLIDKNLRADDEISNVVGDIIRSYTEISELPNQVAVAYVMTTLMRWQTLLDPTSYNAMPPWLRPTPTQLSTPHQSWIDRFPWPKIRDYLINHPEITLDEIAVVYSSSVFIRWAYDPSHVLIDGGGSEGGGRVVVTNPIFEEHLRELGNWGVGERFRKRFPEMGAMVDETSHAGGVDAEG